MKLLKTEEQLDVVDNFGTEHSVGHGKNFASLVAFGSWVISGFTYGSSRCACCGRPIVRVLKLKNMSYEASKERYPDYNFPEEIEIGVVCGPKVFKESCIGFYTEPEREWERQYTVWKNYIKYVLACTKNHEVWEAVPQQLRIKIDEFLASDQSEKVHCGDWSIVRDSKRLLLERTKRDQEKKPLTWDLHRRSVKLMIRANSAGVIPETWTLTPNMLIVDKLQA